MCPIRLLALAVVLWSVAADARAQGEVRVGYYDMVGILPPPSGSGAPGMGVPSQIGPITAAGFTPVLLTEPGSLNGIDVLFVQNPSNTVYGTEYSGRRAAIQSAVQAGMVLVIHDRLVVSVLANARSVLLPMPTMANPMGSGITFTRLAANNVDVADACTFVANGPSGRLTDASLDYGGFSTHGYAARSSLPAGAVPLLHTGDPNQVVAFSYPFGLGFVVYSAIPLDVFLGGSGNDAAGTNFRNTYAPNILAYAAGLRSPSATTLTVDPVEAPYGGVTTFTAHLQGAAGCPAGATIDFSIDNEIIGTAQTDSAGVATLSGILPRTAVPGAHTVAASFSGTAGALKPSAGTAALTVVKASASVEYAAGAFVYDGRPHPATGSVTGVFGEVLGEPLFSYTDATGRVSSDVPPVNAGRYVITARFEGSENYLDTETSSSAIAVEIAPAPLNVIADDKERLVGVPNPVLTISYEGFAPGETAQNLDARPTAMTSVTLATVPGTYAIEVAGAADPNYVVEYVPGTFTVSPEGRLRGQGFTEINGARHHFLFDTRDSVVLGEKGTLSLRIDGDSDDDPVFVSGLLTSVVFVNQPGVTPGGGAVADAVTFAGLGTWRGMPATFQAVAADNAEPGVGHDTLTLTIQVLGRVASRTTGTISGGNIQSNRLPGR